MTDGANEQEGNPQETPQGQSPNANSEQTSEKVYTQKELDAALAGSGRKWKEKYEAAVSESANLKTQLETVTTELEDKKSDLSNVQSDISSLKEQIDDLSKDDPDKRNLVKKLNSLKDEERRIKDEKRNAEKDYQAKLKALENDRNSYSDVITEVVNAKMENLVKSVADGYDKADAKKLGNLCEKAGIKPASPRKEDLEEAQERINAIAEAIWEKKADKQRNQQQSTKFDSGITSGGSELNDEQYIKAYGEGKVNDHVRAKKILEGMK